MMKNLFKRSLLCILAASSMTIGGNIHAVGEQFLMAETSSSGVENAAEAVREKRAKRSEAVEKPDFDAARVKELFVPSGSSGGLDFYVRDEEKIWAAHGGKPDKGSELTEAQKAEQEAAEAEIKEAKKIGDAAALNSSTDEPIASFDGAGETDGIKRYISDKGRYIVLADKSSGKIREVLTVISTLDSANVFLNEDGKTLFLMSENNKKTEAEFAFSSEEDGMKIYTEKDGERFAWVSPELDHFFGIYRYGAENDSFRMLVDDRNAVFGLENKSNGYIWWSSPLGATQDTNATQLLVDGLRSSSSMNFGKPAERIDQNTLRSGNPSECSVKVKDIKNGIRVTYDYKSAGFKYPVEYTLEGDHMKASLKISDIEETDPKNIAMDMILLGNFGAATDDEEGYFIIPDGSGAKVRFDSDKKTMLTAYSQKVYGDDLTFVPTSKKAVTEQIYLPVYGIVKQDNAMLVVASKGDSNASVTLKTSDQSNTNYDICSFSFRLREKDNYYMPGSSVEQFTVFESGNIKSDDIELLYYPIAKEGADYVDVAECCRNYLLSRGGVEKKKTKQGSAPLYLDLYGGVQKKVPILGIPITMKRSVTSYEQAKEILSRLKESGVDDMVVSYNNWTNDGINNKVDTDAKPSGTLGGKSAFRDLKSYIEENDIGFYPVSDNSKFYSGNGYFSFTSTTVRVSGNYSRIVSYDRAYGIPDGFKKNMSLLSPKRYDKMFSDLAEGYSNAHIGGVSLADLTSVLYGDYGKKGISRYGAMEKLVDGYKKLGDTLEDGILADSANAYALPYVSHITGVPMTSSGFDIFDEDIPFLQLVLHGVVPYSTKAINGDPDSEKMLLMAAATGSSIAYDMLYEETSELKDTEYDIYYYANCENQINTAAEEYKLLAPILGSVSDAFIVDYKTENDGKHITAEYSNGNVITVDLDERYIALNGDCRYLSELEKGGVSF